MELAETIFLVVMGLVLLGIMAVACYSIYNCVRNNANRSGYVPIINDNASLFARCRRCSPSKESPALRKAYSLMRTPTVLVDNGGFPINPFGMYGSTLRTKLGSQNSLSHSKRNSARQKSSMNSAGASTSGMHSSSGASTSGIHSSSGASTSGIHSSSGASTSGIHSSRHSNTSDHCPISQKSDATAHSTVATIHVSESITKDAFTPPKFPIDTPSTSGMSSKKFSSGRSFEIPSNPRLNAQISSAGNSFESPSTSGLNAQISSAENSFESPNSLIYARSGNSSTPAKENVVYIPPLPEGDIHSLVRGGKGFYSGDSGTFSTIY